METHCRASAVIRGVICELAVHHPVRTIYALAGSYPAPAAPRARGNAVFPTAVSPKYTNESAGKARMHTCFDQYNANEATNANGGLECIQKSGG